MNQARLSQEAIDGITFDVLRAHLPADRNGDAIFSHLAFLHVHRRAPTERMLLADALHRLKVSPEILDPLRVFTTDKEFVKEYVRAKLGDRYNVPTLQLLRSTAEVDRFAFPAHACVKPTHLSGAVLFTGPDAGIDRDKVKGWMGQNFYYQMREANYRHLTPKIIVEPMIFGDENLSDFKIFCFQGRPRVIQVDSDRRQRHARRLFDLDWRPLDVTLEYPRPPELPPRPANLAEMLAVAADLSAGFSLVRVDLYSNGTACLVGELTHCPNAAMGRFGSPAQEALFSQLIFAP